MATYSRLHRPPINQIMGLPPIEYAGQTTSEILAAKKTHSIASLLFALEEAIHLRQSKRPNQRITEDERVLLAVLALWREVNNGGFAQFFANSSAQYAPEIVPCLQRIGCDATAVLVERAIACLSLKSITPVAVSRAIHREDSTRDERLEKLDREFYALSEIEHSLFRFVETNADNFRLERMEVARPEPKRGVTKAGRLALALRFAPATEHSLPAVREHAMQLASAKGMDATEEECDAAAHLYLFAWFLREGDLSHCAEVASRAFELCREDTAHCVEYKRWIDKLLVASLDQQADQAARQYLDYLNREDKASHFIRKRVGFLAAVVRPYAARLPRAAQYLRDNFTEADIEPPAVIYNGLRALLRARANQKE